MTHRKRIKVNTSPEYPSDAQARDFARAHRLSTRGVIDCHEAYSRYEHSLSVDVLITWGCNEIYFVFAYPPAGFVIIKPEDVTELQTFEGWIFQYLPDSDTMNLLSQASRDGVEVFWQIHKKYKG